MTKRSIFVGLLWGIGSVAAMWGMLAIMTQPPGPPPVVCWTQCVSH